MMFSKLKGGALQLTMFIIVVIALLLAAFILILKIHDRFEVNTQFVKHTIENSNKGIKYALNNDFKSITLHNDVNDFTKTVVSKSYWGVFEKVISTSKIKNLAINKVAILGTEQPRFNRTSLYIEENNRPLVLVGNTRVNGVAFLPKQGVKAGNIAGNSYYGSQLIYGDIKQSNTLPKLNAKSLNHLKNLKQVNTSIPQNAFINIDKDRNHKNSFLKPTKFIVSNKTIRLSALFLTGNIVVKSKTKIIVDGASQLKDIILVAPEIVIKEKVKGNFQAIASELITVEKGVELNYPSALVLINDKLLEEGGSASEKKERKITIKSNSLVKGSVMSITSKTMSNFKPQIVINKNATVVGEVYCNQNIELLGVVKGSVFTSNFIANQFGSIYQNHLYNAKINVNGLNENYSGLLFKNSKKNIAKWLY